MTETIEIKDVNYTECKQPLSKFKQWVCKWLGIERQSNFAATITTAPMKLARRGDIIIFLGVLDSPEFIITIENEIQSVNYTPYKLILPRNTTILVLSSSFSEG